MPLRTYSIRSLFLGLFFGAMATVAVAAGGSDGHGSAGDFPVPLKSYGDHDAGSVLETLKGRIAAEPFNLVATFIFLLAIIHTFLTARFRHWAHEVEHAHAEDVKKRKREKPTDNDEDGQSDEVSFKGQILHFMGEVEAVFGMWAVILLGALTFDRGWSTALDYVDGGVNFTEPMFVVVIMAMASSRPVLRFARYCLSAIASLGKCSIAAWWLSILIVGPVLGSFITEPAAMTISALLLAHQFYDLKPSPRFAYATIGLLFVNISVGGTFTHFAAPPVLMVAGKWGWDMPYMFEHFGWKALIGIVIATLTHFFVFRSEFSRMEAKAKAAKGGKQVREGPPVPAWITVVQLMFMAWTVFVAHHPALFIGGFLFFLAFAQATAHHQAKIDLKPPLLVGFFLAGLVTHGGLQGWWIEPVLKSLGEVPLFVGATVLTAFNDNAAITYLATLVPGFTEELKYAVVAGAVTGGGLTVIANAPNPAGLSILQRYFPEGVSPMELVAGALFPTIVMSACFLFMGTL
ncbi:MAG: putative Na+/H+ antiporter [Candidatus Synoicihabitans palmerolidicus]|nr:putative Na+/H+ antiporter [Candidatus Synoicihabitans palmerolidicus]